MYNRCAVKIVDDDFDDDNDDKILMMMMTMRKTHERTSRTECDRRRT